MGSAARRARQAAAGRAVPVLSGGAALIGSTGGFQEVTGSRQRDPDGLDPGPGRHQWVIAVTHNVVDPEPWVTPGAENRRLLDAESILFTTGVFCWKCEQPYVTGMSPHCFGEPND